MCYTNSYCASQSVVLWGFAACVRAVIVNWSYWDRFTVEGPMNDVSQRREGQMPLGKTSRHKHVCTSGHSANLCVTSSSHTYAHVSIPVAVYLLTLSETRLWGLWVSKFYFFLIIFSHLEMESHRVKTRVTQNHRLCCCLSKGLLRFDSTRSDNMALNGCFWVNLLVKPVDK